jgi:hypothetical protein
MNATVSLDGFIADESDGVGPLFDWYGNGEVAVTMSDPNRVFHVTRPAPSTSAQSWVPCAPQ